MAVALQQRHLTSRLHGDLQVSFPDGIFRARRKVVRAQDQVTSFLHSGPVGVVWSVRGTRLLKAIGAARKGVRDSVCTGIIYYVCGVLNNFHAEGSNFCKKITRDLQSVWHTKVTVMQCFSDMLSILC